MIACWGAGAGPSYRYCLTTWRAGETDTIAVDSHGYYASLKTDLSISMAWGLEHQSDFREDWANKFPDPKASSCYLDYFYNNGLVYRDVIVSVDGGRCFLPLPQIEMDEKQKKITAYKVTVTEINLVRLISRLTASYDYDSYISRSGFTVIDAEWPE